MGKRGNNLFICHGSKLACLCHAHTAKCISAAFLQFFESRFTAKALELYYDVKLLLFSIILRKKAKEIPYMVS